MNFNRLGAGGTSRHGGPAWLVVSLLAAVSACSSTSDKTDASLDALKPADVPRASLDSPPVQDAKAPDTTGDSPVNPGAPDATGSDAPLTPDSAAVSDAPLARDDGAQDTSVLSDARDSSLDLSAKDIVEPDAGTSQDTRTGNPDSASIEDVTAADALLDSDGADAKLDAVRITPVSDPGTPVNTTSKAGTGACQGKTVGSLIEEIHESYPTVLGGGPLYSPNVTDGSFTYVFVRSDGGFSFVFQYGSGDCPAGCIEHEYWYFQTDGDCVPQQVGHYRPSGVSCGTPLWGVPGLATPATLKVCP